MFEMDAVVWAGLYSPEHAVTSLIDLPCSENRNVARQGSLHEIRLTIELARLPRLTRLEHLARFIHAHGDLSLLDKRV